MTEKRLDRIESILERLALSQVENQQQINSNARAIEANTNAIAENKSAIADLRLSITDLLSMLATQANEAAADRAELRRLIEELYGNKRNGNGSSEGEQRRDEP